METIPDYNAFYREGVSHRKIAKKLKIHRHTVKARIDQYEQFKALPLSDQDKPLSLLKQYLKTGAVYDSTKRVKRKLTEEIVAFIEKHLQENKAKRLDGRMKQRLKDMLSAVLNMYAGGYSVLRIVPITAFVRLKFLFYEHLPIWGIICT